MTKNGKLDRIGLSSQGRWALFFKCALLVWLVLFVLEIFILWLEPRLYLGRVRLQVHPESQSYEVFRDHSMKSIIPPTFIQTQFQIITSRETLNEVIEQLQLVKKWDDARTPSDAYGILLQKLEVEEVRGTDLIDIEIFHTDPLEAAELANAIAQAYRNRRNQIEDSRVHAILDMLNAQITLQEQRVEDIRMRMIELVETSQLVDLSKSTLPSTDSPTTPTKGAFMDVVSAFYEKQRAAAEINSQLEVIRELDVEMRTQWMLKSNLLPDAAVAAYQESAALESQYALLLASRVASETDAELVSLKKSIQVNQEILAKAGEDVIGLFEAEEGIATLTAQRYQELVDRLKFAMIEERKNHARYQKVKASYQMNWELLEDMRRVLLEEKVDAFLPRNPVEIHEHAAPNEVPAKPRVRLTLALNATLNILWCIPGGLIVMYFATLYSAWRHRFIGLPDQVDDAIEPTHEEAGADVPPGGESDKW